MSIETYKKKRDFNQTPEPDSSVNESGSTLSFVVQRHHARRLHYDLRLEMEGVYKSWAVPKGPSMVAGDKRLSIMVEDHPLSYGEFYGEIPKGNYGAGLVEIWDKGIYQVIDENGKPIDDPLKSLEKGNLKFVMAGKHLKGEFALVRMNEKDEWLLLKKKDEFALDQFDVASIKSIKTPSAASKEPIEKSSGKNISSQKKSNSKKDEKDEFPTSPPLPMLASLSKRTIDDPEWIYETKYDGYRIIGTINKKNVKLISRNGHDYTEKFESLTKALSLVSDSAIIDGEVVIENRKGVSDFQLLQNYQSTRKGQLKYYLFDLLFLNGHSIMHLPLIQRRNLLEALFEKYTFENIYLSAYQVGNGKALFEMLSKQGYEGVIAKSPESTYLPGKRAHSWLKVKAVKEQEAIICGYTAPQKGRKYFGSILLGMYEDGKLKYIGNCGSGFNGTSLKELFTEFEKITTKQSPFDPPPKLSYPKGKPVWVKPEMVCRIKYSEWTDSGNMRHPVFMGLRPDKNAEEVEKETAITGHSSSSEKSQNMSPLKTTEKQPETKTITYSGKKVKCTNLTKVYWPDDGYTKGDLIAYYQSVRKYILPHLKDRAESLNRYPNGIKAQSFYHKNMDLKNLPDWVKTQKVYSKSNESHIDYLVCNDAATLIYMANLGCIEIHPWHSTIDAPDHPTYMMLDLDPGEISFKEVVNTALIIKDLCDELHIPSYCKTSGSTGLHIYIPLGGKYKYNQVKTFAEILAWMAHQRLPKVTSIERSRAKRKDKVYIDFLQNRKGQTIAAPYSVRPRPLATVSAPLHWHEVNHELSPQMFTIRNMAQRLEKEGDIWAPVLKKGIDLNKVLSKIENSD
jgi:bifunctional non-homologous end joining protein LigD